MPELTITSPYVHSRVDSNTFTIGNPLPDSTLTLCQSRLCPPVRVLGKWPLDISRRFVLHPFLLTLNIPSHFPFFLFRSFAVAKKLLYISPFFTSSYIPLVFLHTSPYFLFLLILSLFYSCLSPFGVSFFSIKYLEGST
jgi:hypothetical protein